MAHNFGWGGLMGSGTTDHPGAEAARPPFSSGQEQACSAWSQNQTNKIYHGELKGGEDEGGGDDTPRRYDTSSKIQLHHQQQHDGRKSSPPTPSAPPMPPSPQNQQQPQALDPAYPYCGKLPLQCADLLSHPPLCSLKHYEKNLWSRKKSLR